MRSVKVPHDKQGLLFFTCRNYINMPEETRRKIDDLCWQISKGDEAYRSALFDMLTTNRGVDQICMKHFVRQKTLYDMRKQFYEEWYKRGPA